ncbi:MAG TPA: HAMP domain-containing sensor histidine kinase [Polyangia bacterium]
MTRVAVGQHHFVGSFLAALLAVLLACATVLLGVSIIMERHIEDVARHMAQRVTPGSHVALELDLAVGQYAIATLIAANGGDERIVTDAQDRLTSAAAAFDGWARASHVEGMSAIAPSVADFQQKVAAANPRTGELDAADVVAAVDELSDVLRVDRARAAAGATRMLDDIAESEQRRRWEEMALMGLVVCGCVALLLAARRREERTCVDEARTVASLERANADLEAFAGRVAHDLRNPLVPILSGSQVIEQANVAPPVKRTAERIERSAKRLSSMIDMLLDFSRMTAPTEATACDVAPVVGDVVEGFLDKARAHGVTISATCDNVRAACEPIVVASPLQNLIDNALKYGRREGIPPVIEVRGFRRGDQVILEVEDRGPGIHVATSEDLFRAFRRGVDGGEGVGLGLATARRLVEARGGSIGLRSGRHGGALFEIRLPAEPPSHPERGNGANGVTVTQVPA